MPKLICPNCAKFVTVPDEAAGTTVPCPECQAPFPVPARYDPVVSGPAAPPPPAAVPPPAPPGLVPEALSAATHAPPPVAAGYDHTVGFSLKPSLVAWVPAVGLTLVLVLTLFTWVGSYVGGSPVYSQSAWGALGNSPYVNHRLEALLKQQTGWPADVLNKSTPDWLLLPYLVMLIAGVVLAWTERLIANPDYTRLPKRFGFVADVWPYRVTILVGLAVLTTALLFAQSARGFGLERAMRQAVAERFAEDRRKNEGNPAEQAAIDYKAGEELNRFNLERTAWFELTVGLHLLVVLAMAGRFWLDRRGTKSHPRIVFQY
ncbi:hypothetical protein J0H58_25015 [bacterium]|nr:hypothetical protein [bacterium]